MNFLRRLIMCKVWWCVLTVFLSLLSWKISDSAHILAIFTETYFSHQNTVFQVVAAIEKAGHRVSFVGPQIGKDLQINFFRLNVNIKISIYFVKKYIK